MTYDGTDASQVAPQAAPPEKSAMQRIAGVLFAPAETFRDIERKPNVLVPLALLVLISIIGTVLVVPRIDFETMTREQLEQSGRKMAPADMEQAVRVGKAMGQVFGYVGPLLSIVGYLLVAGALLLAFRMFGGEGTFKQAFSVTLHSWMPLAINSIIFAIVAASRETLDPQSLGTLVKSNPGFLVDMAEQPVLFSILSSIDVFTIWTLVLLTFGFAAISKFSRGRSAAIVVSLWLVLVIVKVGFAALGAASRMNA